MKKLSVLKGALSFHIADIMGGVSGAIIIFFASDTQEIFYLLGKPFIYLTLLLVTFLFRSMSWLLLYKGEEYYLKSTIYKFVRDYLRIVIVTLCTISAYLLYVTFM